MNSWLIKFRFDSIRSRLIIAFIAFTILPVVVTAIMASSINRRSARLKAEETLNTLAAIKESQVRNWAEDLQFDLAAQLEHEADKNRLVFLLKLDPGSQTFAAAYENQLELFKASLASRPNFEQIDLINLQGEVVLSTDENQKVEDVSTYGFFKDGLKGPTIQTASFENSVGPTSIIAAVPVSSSRGEVMGVLCGHANMDILSEIMLEGTGPGETGETYLIDKSGILLTGTGAPQLKVGETRIDSEGSQAVLAAQKNGVGVYSNYTRIPVIGAYRWIPELQVALLAEQRQDEAFAGLRTTGIVTIAGSSIATIAAVFAAIFVSRKMTQPLNDLKRTAEKIACGDLELRASTDNLAETSALARSFNSMTAQLRNMIGSLEEDLTRRTRQLQRRSDQLSAAAEISRFAATTTDADELVREIVNLIQERYGLYYVGLFMVDGNWEWAVLKAGSGAAGTAMLRLSHRVRIDEDSMIGWSIIHAQPRITLEAGEGPVRRTTGELSETRSAAAIPLRSRGRVLGAISFQSREPGAFDRETLAVFQNIADQVASALDNIRLFAETQGELYTTHKTYGALSRQAWLEKLRARPLSLRKDASGISLFEEGSELESDGNNGDDSKVFPIKARGEIIGYLNAQKRRRSDEILAGGGEGHPVSTNPPWDPGEEALLETLTEQLGVALESARLYEDTQQRAERERIIDEATSRMRATLDLQTILQTAIQEMRDKLELAEVEVRLNPISEGEEESSG